jgi:hypothetical protein
MSKSLRWTSPSTVTGAPVEGTHIARPIRPTHYRWLGGASTGVRTRYLARRAGDRAARVQRVSIMTSWHRGHRPPPER